MKKSKNGLNITLSEKLNKYDNVIQLYTQKPLNFAKDLDEKIIDNNFELVNKCINYNCIIKKGKQTHTNNVRIVTKENLNDVFENTDGLITNLKGVGLVTTLADCQGINLYDPNKEVIANIHAGWKGVFNKIICNCLQIMINEFNCNPKDIIAYITPSIRKCCFEVEEDIKDLFLKEYGSKYISKGDIKNEKQKYFIDTLSINIDNMKKMRNIRRKYRSRARLHNVQLRRILFIQSIY